MEYFNTRFRLLILLYAGYSVKKQQILLLKTTIYYLFHSVLSTLSINLSISKMVVSLSPIRNRNLYVLSSYNIKNLVICKNIF